MAEVLFEITKDNLETGMRGYPVGYCTTSTVDPVKGLFYAGIPVENLAQWAPESVIYLLYHGKEGSPEQILTFMHELHARAKVSPKSLNTSKLCPGQAIP